MNKPRSRLAAYQRQGFCHVSQLLEILFAKYGIDTSGLPDAAGNSANVGDDMLQPATHTVSAVPANVTTAAPHGCREQTTFSWFQPAELTV